MAWRDEMAALFAPAERELASIADDLAECRRGAEARRTADISVQRAYAARLAEITEELDQ